MSSTQLVTRSYKLDTLAADKRPFEVQLDVEALNRRKKVSQILSGGPFKDELESILKDQISGSQKRSVVLKKLQETVIPAKILEAAKQATPLSPPLHLGELIVPINDLRGSNASKYTIPERQLRCKLASICRLSDMFGWSTLIHNLVTAVCSASERSVLVNPYGLMCYEVTASNLVKVGYEGDIFDYGGTQFEVDHPDLPLHLSLYARMQDIRCIIPVRNSAGVAVSCMSCGLLGMSEKALMVGKISYTDLKEDVDLDPTSKILFVRGQGFLAFGQSVEEAFHYAYHAVRACEIQVSAITAGMDSLSTFGLKSELKPVDQQREFEGLMRMLDNKGYNTGYEYKCWDLFQPPPDAGYEARKKERESKRAKQLEQKGYKRETPLVETTETAQTRKLHHKAGSTVQTEQHNLGLRDLTSTSEQPRIVPGSSRRLSNSNSNVESQTNSNAKPYDRPRDEAKAAVPDTRRHPEAPFFQPLERAMNAAKQVAYSTHQAVEKLILLDLPDQEIHPQPYQPPAMGMAAPTLKSEAASAQYVTSGLPSSNGQWYSPATNEGSSGLRTRTVLFSNDHMSAEKAANAARVVAKNTAEAVRKMTGSLKEPATPSLSPV